jgi:hypothetical protein
MDSGDFGMASSWQPDQVLTHSLISLSVATKPSSEAYLHANASYMSFACHL